MSQLIIDKATGLVKYDLDDTDIIIRGHNCIFVTNRNLPDHEQIIGDMNYYNSTLERNVTDVPADFVGNRYKRSGSNFIPNSKFKI